LPEKIFENLSQEAISSQPEPAQSAVSQNLRNLCLYLPEYVTKRGRFGRVEGRFTALSARAKILSKIG